VTLTATISVIVPGGGNPTGTVDFWDGAVGSGTYLGSNSASTALGVTTSSLSVSSLGSGSHTVFAVYSGSANYAGSVGQMMQVVTPPPPTLVSTVVNGADPALLNLPAPNTNQRSMVRSLQLTFDIPVTLTPAAVTIAVHAALGTVPEVISVLNSTGGTGL